MALGNNFLWLKMSGEWSVCEQKRGEEAGGTGRDQLANSLASIVLRSIDFIPNGESSKDFKKQGRINK